MSHLKNLEDLSPDEVREGLMDVRQSLEILKNDLNSGHETEDHHYLAVRARNISLKVAGLSVLAATGLLIGLAPTQAAPTFLGLGVGMKVSILVLLGSAATSAITEGYIYLNRSEVEVLQSKIKRIEKKIAKIQQRLG
jgi:hypothetical protein